MTALPAPAPATTAGKHLSRWLAAALLLLAACLSPPALHGQADSAAAPARWEQLHANDFMSLWIDTRTVQRGEGAVLTASTEFRFPTPRQLSDPDTRYDAMRSRDDYDCEERRFRRRRVDFYLEGTGVRSSDDNPEGDAWREPEPESVWEALVNRVCVWAGYN